MQGKPSRLRRRRKPKPAPAGGGRQADDPVGEAGPAAGADERVGHAQQDGRQRERRRRHEVVVALLVEDAQVGQLPGGGGNTRRQGKNSVIFELSDSFPQDATSKLSPIIFSKRFRMIIDHL